MPSSDATVICRGGRLSPWLFLVLCVTAVVAGPTVLALVLPRHPGLAYLLPVPYAVFLFLTVRLFRIGTGRVPAGAMVAGAVFFVGGIALDLTATVIHSPDLVLEANPVVRALLGRGHAVGFVYGYGLTLQALVALVNCMLWATFLRHRHTWVRSSRRNVRSFGQFLAKAVTGQTLRCWAQLTRRLTRTERLRAFYHVLWILLPMRFGTQVNRWYLGASWFRLVPVVPEPYVPVAGIVLFETAVVAWLWRQYVSRR